MHSEEDLLVRLTQGPGHTPLYPPLSQQRERQCSGMTTSNTVLKKEYNSSICILFTRAKRVSSSVLAFSQQALLAELCGTACLASSQQPRFRLHQKSSKCKKTFLLAVLAVFHTSVYQAMGMRHTVWLIKCCVLSDSVCQSQVFQVPHAVLEMP